MCFKRHQTHKYDYLLVFLWRNKYSSTSKNTFSYIKPGLIKKIYYFDLVCIFLGTELFKLNSFLKILLYLPNIPKTFIIFLSVMGATETWQLEEKMQLENQQQPWKLGSMNTRRTHTQRREKRSCWPSSPRWHSLR